MPKLNVFISYAHKDEAFKDALETHLAMLRRSDKIATWTDRAILPGTEWDAEIKQQLERADLILLLISAAFIASEYIWNEELTRAMERHRRGDASIIPIFIKPCDWHDAPFGKLQGLPGGAKPVGDPGNDEAWSQVAKGIRAVVDHLLARSANINVPTQPSPPPANTPLPGAASADVLYQEGIRNQMDILIQKLNRIRQAYAIETDAGVRFKYEQEIKGLEEEIEGLRGRL